MLITQEVEVIWSRRNLRYYEERGYVCTGYGHTFTVAIEHLMSGSKEYVDLTCDYCGFHLRKQYYDYLKGRESVIKKDCCLYCAGLKTSEAKSKSAECGKGED